MNRFDTTIQPQNRFSVGTSPSVQLPKVSSAPVLDPNLKISQGTQPGFFSKLFEPVANFFTNTTPRERGSIQSAAATHQPQEQGFTSIKVPFVNAQIPLQSNFITDTVKNLVETPERFVQTVKESHDLATKGFVPPPENGVLNVDSYLKVNSDFYNKAREAGMSDVQARIVSGIYTVGQGALDASIVGGLLEKAAVGTLDATAESVAKKQAWEVLGMPQSTEEAQKNFLDLAHKYHPDLGGNEATFKIINNANTVLKERGIPSLIEQKAIPNVRQWAKQLLSSPGAEISADTVASPIVSGQLPGYAPEGGKPQPKFGLSIQPVENVGGPSFESASPELIKAKIAENIKYYVTDGGATVGRETANPALRDLNTLFNTPEGKAIGSKTVAKFIDAGLLKVGPDGKIPLYRVGKPSTLNDLVSTTYDPKYADTFSQANKNAPIQEIRVKPSDIKYVMNGPEKEVLIPRTLFETPSSSLPNIKPKTIRDEAKISELTAQKQNLQLQKETNTQVFDQQTESNYQEFKKSLSRFKDIPADVPQYKALTGRGTATDNLLYSQTLNEDEVYNKFIDRYNADKKITSNLADLQAELRAVKGKAIKDYTPEQLARINAIAQDVSSSGTNIPQVAEIKEVSPSIAGQVDQVLAKAPEIVRKEVSSLGKIISQDVRNVKNKVNIIDYLRTPDRVLKKIGLESESKALLSGYNAYVKELPKNIDKITEWAKQVPKESSKTIFQYLDGQNVTLNPTELKIANEIKQWLKEWAVRLKLPEDKTITNYITHIFDKELIAKEFDEDLAKIITDKVPGSVYDPFLLQRLGAKGYKQNVWEALDAYVKRGTRKANMDEALKMIQDKVGRSLEVSRVDASAFKYIQRYISGVNMRPTELDNLLDNSIKNIVGYKFGQRPVTYLTKALRQMTYRGMLGLNVSSTLRNISQGVNTYATLGEKYTAIGYAKLFSHGAFQELEQEGVLGQNFIQDRTLSSTKKNIERVDKVLFSLFEGAEKINRGSAYFGAKAKALAQGKTLEEAIAYGKEIVRKTQFTFGSVDIPVALQSDIVKTIAQFQNFTLKQTEFLAEMVKDKNFVGLLRYIIGGLVFVYTVGKAFGMDPQELLPNYRFGVPPSLTFPTEVGKALLNTPDKYGNTRDLSQKLSDISKAGIGLIPAGSQINKTVGGIKAIQEGGSYTKSHKLQFKQGQSLPEKVQSILFGKYASQNAKNYFNKSTKPAASTVNRFSQ